MKESEMATRTGTQEEPKAEPLGWPEWIALAMLLFFGAAAVVVLAGARPDPMPARSLPADAAPASQGRR